MGLPLAAVFATKELQVIGIENNKERLEQIKRSICPFHDPSLQSVLSEAIKVGHFQVRNSVKEINDNVDIIFIAVGTPNTIENSVDYSQIYGALEEVCNINLTGKMIIMRSTMPPKTTLDIVIPFLEYRTSLKCGQDFCLAVCPERILEGHAIEELHNLPEIVGGINKTSNDIASSIFKIINPQKEILYTSPSGAELAKLFTNIYRYISFALSNEFAIWGEIYGLDAAELIKIANYNYSRSNIPIPGFVGGPCLSKDGTFLDNNTTFASIVSTAWKLNESIPQHIVNNINKIVGNLFNKKITVLGLSYKAASDDLRQSPSVKLVEILKSKGAKVLVHDPHIKGTLSIKEVLNSPDVVIIATNHREFNECPKLILHSGCKLVYDVWSMFHKDDFPNCRYVKFGQGI